MRIDCHAHLLPPDRMAKLIRFEEFYGGALPLAGFEAILRTFPELPIVFAHADYLWSARPSRCSRATRASIWTRSTASAA